MSVREGFRKLASLGHELLDFDTNFSYSRLFRNETDSPGKCYLSLIWMKFLVSAGLIKTNRNSPAEIFPLAQEYLNQIPHPTGQSPWNFFMGVPKNFTPLDKFWQAASDPRFNEIWRDPESLGWLFQYFLAPGLEIFRSPQAPKIKASQLAMRTQQFTPRWIADFLVQNTLGRLWVLMHSDSQLPSQWPYFIPPNDDLPPCQVKSACDIKILDPACGTMHLGLSAMTILTSMYQEELAHAGKPGWPEKPSVRQAADIPHAIVQNNLYGIDLDPIALELSTLTMSLACGSPFLRTLNLLQADSLKTNIRSRFRQKSFPQTFDIILLNPPYLDRRDFNPKLKAYMMRHYKNNGRNLYTAFLEKSMSFLTPGGRLGAVTPQTFMFISSFDSLRQTLLDQSAIETLVHTGLNTFDDAVVDCAFYILRREELSERRTKAEAKYFHLTSLNTPEEKNTQLLRLITSLKSSPENPPPQIYTYRQTDFAALPGSPWVYWIGSNIRRLFRELPTLVQTAELRQGLATTDNERFLRFCWEIPRDRVAFNCHNLRQAEVSGQKWFPYLKGGGFRKWYGMQQFLVNWGNNGLEIKNEIVRRYPYLKGEWRWVAKNTEFYFREGLTYSYLTSGKFNARFSPAGSIFDVAGSSIFPDDPIQILGILNSRFCRFALGLINHTVNFQVGDLGRLPVPRETSLLLKTLVSEAIKQARHLETFDETSPEFTAPPSWPEGKEMIDGIYRRLDEIQREVDREVYRLYRLDSKDQRLIENHTLPDDPPETLSPRALAEKWLSYAMGVALGRYGKKLQDNGSVSPFIPLLPDENIGLVASIRSALENLLGPLPALDIIREITGGETLYSYLESDFFEQHYRLYCHRPVYWLLKRKKTLSVVYYQSITDENLCKFLPAHKNTIHFEFDDGVKANMKKIKPYFAIPAWTRGLS